MGVAEIRGASGAGSSLWEDSMTKLAVRFLVVASLAAGCSSYSDDLTPIPPGPVSIDDPSTMCASVGVTGASTGQGFATSGMAFFGSSFSPQVGATHSATVAPPAISGGTLRILADGNTAVASDPDRDRVYVVDLAQRKVTATVQLQASDEPGRVAADAAGRVHVALRHGGALVTIEPSTGAILSRRAVCAAPRGVAYEPATDLVHVACADGQLVSFPAAGGAATRRLQLVNDLRDVVVVGADLQVTRFKSAQLLTVKPDGTVMQPLTLPGFRSQSVHNDDPYTAAVAWRAVEMPAGGVAILHQRGLDETVTPTAGGYGGANVCDAIVQTAITTVAPGADPQTGPALSGMVVAVDMALSADGSRVAVISAGNATNSETPGGTPRLPRVFVTDMASATDSVVGCMNDGQHAPCLPVGGGFGGGIETGAAGTFGADVTGAAGATDEGTGSAGSDLPVNPTAPAPDLGGMVAPDAGTPITGVSTTCGTIDDGTSSDPTIPQVVGQPIAVAFAADGRVVVQVREPAALDVPGGAPITLATESRSDTGHDLFHANAGGMIACASCHAEGNEDGRVWTFACEGARRTQSLQVGLKGTEPFHWGGDEKTFPQLINDVFVGRMSGPQLQSDQVDATLNWIDAQPRLAKPAPTDLAAVARGQALFNDPAHAGCVTCHNGPSLTNNQTVDVGTKGGAFQVPSLVGIGTRGPFMHNGCATTLRDRFTTACGGDKHGVTANLTTGQIDDLVAYLDTL
jgi:Cytochrome c